MEGDFPLAALLMAFYVLQKCACLSLSAVCGEASTSSWEPAQTQAAFQHEASNLGKHPKQGE